MGRPQTDLTTVHWPLTTIFHAIGGERDLDLCGIDLEEDAKNTTMTTGLSHWQWRVVDRWLNRICSRSICYLVEKRLRRSLAGLFFFVECGCGGTLISDDTILFTIVVTAHGTFLSRTALPTHVTFCEPYFAAKYSYHCEPLTGAPVVESSHISFHESIVPLTFCRTKTFSRM